MRGAEGLVGPLTALGTEGLKKDEPERGRRGGSQTDRDPPGRGSQPQIHGALEFRAPCL